jgi:hypothetical protein
MLTNSFGGLDLCGTDRADYRPATEFSFSIASRFRLESVWLRRIFLTAVWALGLKALVFDVFAKGIGL